MRSASARAMAAPGGSPADSPGDSPGAADAKRRAAAERAMRLQFVQGIKKKGMTDFEVSMIQESRKGGRSPGRRR